ncbi:ATP-binding cassette domain-containing protein [Corynebacterium sp. zg-331]|uniref:ATP-binding cassette domain-containing protein n=1 Tax=unclassified Corynebacterium TaxID=2624378 RepID=UPI00128DF411|nr:MULTISPECIES: ATP-binding cassette domain-containing protein [unclassified Corynebacterium]MBC3185940.1 ATP-binding cassette domain-containing protein [Corynebacterium sp. zg-331]MPV52431.1 ATP-binding cassette domain-containing protein [Corynebacterium sp. zg331]
MNLSVTSVQVRYGARRAVDGVTWNLGRGIHALLGPNGAGKSSLISAIATLKKPSAGTIRLGEYSGEQLRGHVGYLPQDNLGRSRMTVREHFAYMCWLRTIEGQAARQEIARLLALTGLEDRADARIASLSGGMRRRVGIGSACTGRPPLLLDEPSAGLDVEQRAALRGIIRQAAGHGVVVISTHILEDVIGLADTVAVMVEGALKYHGSWEDFAGQPEIEAVRRAYLEIAGGRG